MNTWIPCMLQVDLSWLDHCYLHIIIHGIIIAIVALSCFDQSPPAHFVASSAQEDDGRTVVEVPMLAAMAHETEDRVVDSEPVMVNGSVQVDEIEIEEDSVANGQAEAEFVDGSSEYNSLPPASQPACLLPVKPTTSIPEKAREPRHDAPKSTRKKTTQMASRAAQEAPEEIRDVVAPPPAPDWAGRNNDINFQPCPAGSGIWKETYPIDELELYRGSVALITKMHDQWRQEKLNDHATNEVPEEGLDNAPNQRASRSSRLKKFCSRVLGLAKKHLRFGTCFTAAQGPSSRRSIKTRRSKNH